MDFYNYTMIKRHIIPLLQKRLRLHPAVALLGPRQSGKTTLAQSLGGQYFDIEQASDRLAVDLQWEDITHSKQLIIFDEAQVWPELFPRLRGAIDQDRKRSGRFLILGSIAPSLMHHVSESLAGRLSLCELTPFNLIEVPKKQHDHLWLKGGYPDGGILKPKTFPEWQHNYLSLLAQRDLPDWGLASKPKVTERFFAMIAAVHGQLWNASQIGKSLGLSYHTVNSYLDYLEQAYLVRRLYPWSGNVKKRLVKSPKVFWRDTGLLHSLLNVTSFHQLLAQPWVGHSWEGWVIEQILNALTMQNDPWQASFFRSRDNYEIDLILEYKKIRWAIEIKLTAQPDASQMQRLITTARYVQPDKIVLLSRTNTTIEHSNVLSTNLFTFLKNLG